MFVRILCYKKWENAFLWVSRILMLVMLTQSYGMRIPLVKICEWSVSMTSGISACNEKS